MLEWLSTVGGQVVGMSLQHAQYLLGFAAAFMLIERLWPAVPTQHRWRRGSATDLALSFLNPLIVWPINVYIVAALINALLAAIGWETHGALRASIAAQPYWLQLIVAMLVADFFSYWKHRVFHMRWLWPIHSVHHATPEVDWLTNDRDHPLQLAGTYLFVLTGLAVAGFSNEMIATQAVIRRAYSLYTHCNVAWGHGPLSRVLVGPALHRWHHASDDAVIDRNFATMFSFFDVVFGTYALPSGQPRAFGVPGEPAPETLRAALAHPVHVLRRRQWEAASGESSPSPVSPSS
jgi:sterol desaturase/sphingolipid hydroxylase (fatty acid hydroxylase superfamily)